MIIKLKYSTRYFGKDAGDFLENINWHSDIQYLGKECTTKKGKQGIIVGFEDNHAFDDYYYIIYDIEDRITVYELANNTKFVETIKV